jgi:hypothetical protein
MSNEQTPKVPATSAQPAAGMTTEQLLQLFLSIQQQAIESNKELADSIRESRKPYVDPRVLEQKRIALEERQNEIRRELRRRIATKAQCPHVRDNGTSSINWMEHSNNIVKGVCSNCFSEFDTRNSEDLKLLRGNPKALKAMGRAGQHATNRFIG